MRLGCLTLGLLMPTLLAVMTAKAAEGPMDSPPSLVSLRIIPEEAILWGIAASQHFVVMGEYGDGLRRDVTARCRLTVSHPERASLAERGRVVARADGAFELTAEFDGQKAMARVRVEGSDQTRPFSFQRDIGGILTRRGCNTVDCHGGVKGRNGFKLSLGSQFPRDDHHWIVEGGRYEVLSAEQSETPLPRVDLNAPEQSLLLLKSTGAVAHGGGTRIDVGSRDYQAILEWIREGAAYGEEDSSGAVPIEGLEIFPRHVVLDRVGKQQLLVAARLADGRREDVTDQVRYVSSNETVARVDAEGRVEAVSSGETAVMVRAAGHAASTRVGVITRPIAEYPSPPPARNLIDEHVFAKLRKFNIVPSEVSIDAEFLRRVCLDLTGTLPPADRARKFLTDPNPNKRDALIETLLASPEYVDFWTYRFADLFRVGFSSQQDLKKTHLYQEWVRNRIARNVPYDQIARERIAAQGYGGPTTHFYRTTEKLSPQTIMAEQMRVFHGLRLECAECHNHPFDAWSQDQFWGLASFFNRMIRTTESDLLVDRPFHASDSECACENKAQCICVKVLLHPRTKAPVVPAFLDGQTPAGNMPLDLRRVLAEWMTSPENPYFARAAVNRIWGDFFGRGIVQPVDDFRATNPPTHHELLEALARDFAVHGFDLKHLIRTIVQSGTYQLSSKVNDSNREDRINYSRFQPRMLDAVVLVDAISRVTGVEETFLGEPYIGAGPYPEGSRAIDLVPDIAPHRFLEVHGRPTRQVLPEKPGDPTLGQALHMFAGSTYTDKISTPGGRVDLLLTRGADDREIIEEFYLTALCRHPTEWERTELEKLIAEGPSRDESVKALVWGIITAREFTHNH